MTGVIFNATFPHYYRWHFQNHLCLQQEQQKSVQTLLFLKIYSKSGCINSSILNIAKVLTINVFPIAYKFCTTEKRDKIKLCNTIFVISQLSGASGTTFFLKKVLYRKFHCCKHILTREQNFKIKTHNFLKVNSVEQYEEQIILIGCCHSNAKNVIKFHKFPPSPSETAMEHSTDLKLMQCI